MNAHAASDGPILRLDRLLRKLITAVGRAIGLLLLLLVGVIVFDVLTRGSLFVSSTALQELEWHLHTAVLMLALGYAYITDTHVRIGFVRDRLPERGQALVEAIGCLVFLAPFCIVSIHYGIDFALTSLAQNERSPSPGGLPYRWIVKSTVPIGMGLLLLAGIAVFIRAVLRILDGRGRSKPLFDPAGGSSP